jgi:glycosyltransferase involved in cell wall biosynthesis
MKVLLVVHIFFPNWRAGTEVYTLNVARKLLERGHEVQLVCYEPSPTNTTEITTTDEIYDGFPVHRISFSHDHPDRLLREYFNSDVEKHLIDYYARIKPDIVHVMHSMHLSAAAITAAKYLGFPVVCTATDFWFVCPTYRLLRVDNSACPGPVDVGQCIRCYGLLEGDRGNQSLTKAALRRLKRRNLSDFLRIIDRPRRLRQIISLVDMLIIPNRSTFELLHGNGLRPQRSIVLGFGLTLPSSVSAAKIPSDKLRLGYIGSFDNGKGPHVALEALRSLPSEHRIELTLYGDPRSNQQYFAALQQIAGQDERIRFAGTFPNEKIGEIFSKIDILVIPSLWYENTPLVLYSAFATKTPVLVSNIGSLAEVVSHGQNGLVFEVGNAADLARQIESLVQDPASFERLRQGIPPVKSIDQNVVELLDIYSALALQPAVKESGLDEKSLAKWLDLLRSGGVVTRLTGFERCILWTRVGKKRAQFGENLELRRCQYSLTSDGQLLLRFVWNTRRLPEQDFLVVVEFLNGESSVLRSEHRIREYIGRNGMSSKGLFAYCISLRIPNDLKGLHSVRLALWDPTASQFVSPTRVEGWRQDSSSGLRLKEISLY